MEHLPGKRIMNEINPIQQDLSSSSQADQIVITYYTDPLCCWSWAFEPQWRRLKYEFKDRITFQYKMGGMISNWNHFSDPMNSVTKPVQMGPVWMEARHITGMPIHDSVWLTDPPSSSYPACIAVKTAALQSPGAEEQYLRKVREAIMLDGKNISRTDVLMEIADSLAAHAPELFNSELFRQQFNKDESLGAFKEDLTKVRYHRITRFPTLTISKNNQAGVIIVGYRPYAVLLNALSSVVPGIESHRASIDKETYASYWNTITERELEEIAL